MEFNFLGNDLKTPSLQFLSPMKSHFSEPSLLRGGFPNTEQILNADVACEDKDILLRKLEKERIRREIISGEITRRRMLEEEVRIELMLEREVAFRRSLGEKFLLDEQVAMGLMPQIKLDPKINMDKLIMLAQPNPDIYKEKRKAVTQEVDDDDTKHSPVVVKKKPKDDWNCALCNVGVTSEKSLNEHLQGKKHKAKESAQKRTQKSPSPSFTSKNSEQSLKPTETIATATETIVTTTTSDLMEAKADAQAQPEMTMVDTNQTVVAGKDLVGVKTKDEEIVEKTQNTEDSEKQNGTGTEQQVRIPAAVKKGFKFWCELCHVGSFSVVVMENHKRGRKHTNRLKRSRQNDENAPPTFAAVPEATPLLTKDA